MNFVSGSCKSQMCSKLVSWANIKALAGLYSLSHSFTSLATWVLSHSNYRGCNFELAFELFSNSLGKGIYCDIFESLCLLRK